jgi:hypothetical protein
MANGLTDEPARDPEGFPDDGLVRGDAVLFGALILPAGEGPR